jgi:CBS domain-containing protein
MQTVRDVLRRKGNQVFVICPDATTYDALVLMAEHNVGALLVLDEQSRLSGIVSERDYARKVALYGRSSRTTLVREIMTEAVHRVRPEQTVEDCMALMTEHRVRHLPVLDGGELIGVISIGDVVKAIITEQEFVIEQLQSYIRGGR